MRQGLTLFWLLSIWSLAGCALNATGPNDVARRDLGPLPASTAARLARPVLVFDVATPAWLDGADLLYRLAYQDVSQTRAYALTRWSMPLPALLTRRLREQFSSAGVVLSPVDGFRAPISLRVEIDELTQVFDTPDRSYAVLRARATLLGNQTLIGQRTFSLQRPSATADASGGIKAIGEVSDQLIAELIDWVTTASKN